MSPRTHVRTDPEPLAGRCIAIAEGRELDVFAGLLTRRGARVLRYPLVRIVDAADPAPGPGLGRTARAKPLRRSHSAYR